MHHARLYYADAAMLSWHGIDMSFCAHGPLSAALAEVHMRRMLQPM